MDRETILERISKLESVELQSGDDTKEEIYIYLLILYMLNNEAMKAKFVWKRIPQLIKSKENTELSRVWNIVQNLITRKYSIAFQLTSTYSTQWSNDELKFLVDKLIEKTRESLFHLISNAYSSISVQELSSVLNLSTEETLKISLQHGWALDDTKSFLIPKKQPKEEIKTMLPQDQMQQLTNLVSYLEN